MGDLKPLGSEKLQGIDKIQRILEISRFKENIPSSINETSRNEYKVQLADGKEYQIVKEKVGYVIKKTINESETEYIEPMKNRKYFSSYSQALKRLNLMAKETNTLFENNEGISLFEQKKFVLKTPKPATPPPPPQDEVENVPPPPPAPEVGATPPPPPPGDDMGAPPPPPSGDEGMDVPSEEEDMGGDIGMGDEGIDGQEQSDEVVTFKTIQKLTGRLGQKLRTLNADEENKMNSKDIKYVINSILSALDLDNLDEDDREQIINKFEGIEGEEEMNMSDTGSDEIESDLDIDQELEKEPIEVGEIEETWDDLGEEIAIKTLSKGITPGEFSEELDKFEPIKIVADEMFTEQKIENILSKYFVISENEKKFNKIKDTQNKIINSEKNKNLAKEIKRLSESVLQEIAARKFLKEKPTFKFIGKSNKKNLVFENKNLEQIKISPEGNIL